MALWKKYSLGIVLLVGFVAAWALMTWTDWVYFVSEQVEHHQSADVFGASGYIWQWGLDTFSNWQADFLGQGLGIILGAYVLFVGSEESKDTSDQVQSITEDIERQVLGQDAADRAERRTEAETTKGGNLRRYGLGYALMGAFAISFILMTWMGWMNYAANSKEHREVAEVFGTSGYIWEWLRQVFENWQADFLGHALLVILPAYLLYKSSAQSREGIDQVEAALRRVQLALRRGGSTDPGLIVETRTRPHFPVEGSIWKRYGLGIILMGIFLVTWILQTWSGWGYFVSEQLQHHSAADLFGPSGYIWLWGEDTFSNWQSDLLWTGIIVMLGAYLLYQGSAESRESDDHIEEMAFAIERRVRGDQAAERDQQATRSHVFGDIWHNRGLAWSMIIAGVIAWVLMTWMGWMNFVSTQHEHGTSAEVFGSSGYIWNWARLTLENWQSDILGNLATVVLSAYLLYQGSGLSRESDDQIEASLERIQASLETRGGKTPVETNVRSIRGSRTAGS